MLTESLRKKIRSKFGTFSKFAKLAKLDRYEFQKEFLSKEHVTKEYYEQINALYTQTKDQIVGDPLTRAEIASLKKALNEVGGVIAFCRENKGFSEHTVFQIQAGKYKIKTPKVKQLLTALGI